MSLVKVRRYIKDTRIFLRQTDHNVFLQEKFNDCKKIIKNTKENIDLIFSEIRIQSFSYMYIQPSMN